MGGCNKNDTGGAVDSPLMKDAPPKPANLKGTPALTPMGSGGGKAATAGGGAATQQASP